MVVLAGKASIEKKVFAKTEKMDCRGSWFRSVEIQTEVADLSIK